MIISLIKLQVALCRDKREGSRLPSDDVSVWEQLGAGIRTDE